MTLRMFVFSHILILILSCSGQTSPITDRTFDDGNLSFGQVDTVSEIADSILYIYQDKKNNYWFGSNGRGVYCYNGKTIVHFTTKDGLTDNRIWKIEEDKNGNIYFTTMAGINKFDPSVPIRSGELPITTLNGIKSNRHDSGWILNHDDLWFQGAPDSGLVYRYDGKILYRLKFPQTKEGEDLITRFPRSKYPLMKFNPYDVYSVFKDSKGKIWFGTNPLGVCNYDGKSFTWIPNTELGLDEIALGVRSVVEDNEGNFWFSNTKHRYTITPDHDGQGINFRRELGIVQSKENKDADYRYFMSGLVDSNGDLWMATFDRGVWRYDGKDIFHYPVKKGDTNVTLFSIYRDRQGELWLGTHIDGAYKFNGKTFEKFKF